MQSVQKIEDHFAGPEVEIAGGFVGEQERRISDQSAGQHHSLLFAPGEFPGAVRGAGLQAGLIQPRQRTGTAASAWETPRISSGIITFSSAVNSGSR